MNFNAAFNTRYNPGGQSCASRTGMDIPEPRHTKNYRRFDMPHIQVHAIKDVFSKAQKREVIERLTDAMVSVEGEEDVQERLRSIGYIQ